MAKRSPRAAHMRSSDAWILVSAVSVKVEVVVGTATSKNSGGLDRGGGSTASQSSNSGLGGGGGVTGGDAGGRKSYVVSLVQPASTASGTAMIVASSTESAAWMPCSTSGDGLWYRM